MCGRYSLYNIDEIGPHYGLDVPDDIAPNWNAAPTQHMPVVRINENNKVLEIMHWGIPRLLGRDIVKNIFNTRADKAFGPFWKKQVTTQRCLVPFDSFYEWKLVNGKKVPFIIRPEDEHLYSFAGIWNEWMDENGITFNAYSIMTTEPNREMREIHNRMPIILTKEEEEGWLDSRQDTDSLSEYLHPFHDHGLSIEEGSPLINNASSNDETLIRPINLK